MLETLKKIFLVRKWLGQISVLRSHGIRTDFPKQDLKYQPKDSKLLYLLHNSLPLHSAGYATRTQGLLEGLFNQGFSPIGVTRYGYPEDLKLAGSDSFTSNNIRYLRISSPDGKGYRQLPLDIYLKRYAEALFRLTLEEKPSLLHAASNFLNGLAANSVGKELGIPVVYEVRGLWELTRLSREAKYEHSRLYKLYVKKETECCLEADHVLAITESLKNILIERGVPAEQITVISNAVSEIPASSSQEEKDRIRNELEIESETPIIGYIGSLLDYEGLDDLILALAAIKELRWHFIVVGDGAAKASLENLASTSGLNDRITFTGRVPFSDVSKYYSIIDICPFPRKALPVCEVVSPIKPFEAMAAGKIVLCSDVGALSEIVSDKKTGYLFKKGSVDSLSETLERILSMDSREKQKVSEAAVQWIAENRTWEIQARKIAGIYKKLLSPQ